MQGLEGQTGMDGGKGPGETIGPRAVRTVEKNKTPPRRMRPMAEVERQSGPVKKKPAFKPFPSKLFVEPTTRCNLACRMCVRQAPGCGIREEDLDLADFEKLRPLFPQLSGVVFSGIGEPLLHPHLEAMVSAVRNELPQHGRIGLQSNGSLVTGRRASALVSAGVDNVCLSLDTTSPVKFEQIRPGTTLADLVAALKAWQWAVGGHNRPVRVGVEYVLMRENLAELPNTIGTIADLGADFVIVTHLLPYNAAQNGQTVYDANTDASLALFARWKEKAVRSGIEVENYFKALQKFYKVRTEHDRSILDWVAQLKEEAQQEDVPIHLRNLFGGDVDSIREVGKIFAAAQAVADKKELELELPALMPRHNRCCRFVEEGGLFVAANGKLHPCYSTWHGYTCYVDGREKKIRPKVFGDIASDAPESVWNRPDFIAFRRAVLRYDYPYCRNCTYAPCDHITRDDFVRDCYTTAVPCGDCLWCEGLLSCLQ